VSYRRAIEAAGAVVHEYGAFGDYQGTWWAKVTFEGKNGWVRGNYGSCSGCDAFQEEFGYDTREECDEHAFEYPVPEDCVHCKRAKAAYQTKLIAFGLSYLTSIMSQQEAEQASTPDEWDEPEAHNFIKEHAWPYAQSLTSSR
jgi:hypothetical protein